MNVYLLLCVPLVCVPLAVQGQEGQLRLVDNSGSTGGSIGRLEVYLNGQWGTVCDDYFDVTDARVACRQLGYADAFFFSNYSVVTLGLNQGSPSTPTWLDNLACNGSEIRLIDCSRATIENCSHDEDVGLFCLRSFSSVTPFDPGSERDARLVGVNGLTRGMAGRVEVYTSGQWITITESSTVGKEEADVICRQLGFPNSVYYGSVGDLGFSQGVSTRSLSTFSCSGSQTRWTGCVHSTSSSVSHSRDFAVSCGGTYNSTGVQDPPANGDLRLNTEGSSRTFSGRLEIYYNGQWGTVCDDRFAQPEADVACRQLGFIAALYYGSIIGFSGGSGQIWLDNVDCSSSHTGTLANCSHSAFGIINCTHSEDVALVCVGAGSLRLTSDPSGSTSASLSSGRLEVYAGGRWGTVCDDGFGQNDADVACRQLGFIRASRFDDVRVSSNYNTSLPILLDDVTCSSSDNLLLLCSHRGIGVHNCGHHEDIEITCFRPSLEGSEGNAKLVGVNGLTRGMAGRVEVYTSGQWISITESSTVGREEADVICRQLGFPNSVYYGTVGDLGFSQGVSMRSLNPFSCSGSQTRWTNCSYSTSSSVSHSRDFAVSCGGTYSSTGAQDSLVNGDLRLNTAGSTRTFSGRLEIYYNGQWGTVCDDGFAKNEADVACRQLGFIAALYYGNRVGISGGSGQIWLDNVDCSSSHTGTLADCSHSAFGSHDCVHSEDVALVCVGEGSLRLTSDRFGSTSASLSSGRLEVYAGRRWGTVCDDGFGQNEADIACQQLGYARASSFDDVRVSSDFDTSLPILLDDVTCSSSDNLLLLCSHRGIGVDDCSHSEDIEITCRSSEEDARLVGVNGLTRGMAGRVEVSANSQWITITESSTTGKEEADVICKQLGFPNSVYYGSVGDLGFSQGVSTRSLSTFSCSGSQTRWARCHYSTSSSVSHSSDFAVSCGGTYSSAGAQYPPANGDLRLNTAGSSRTFSGRLEIYYNGQWGTVCDDGFAQTEADVACRQLGFVAALYYGSNIGIDRGSGQIWLDDVDCSSSHTGTLADCSHSSYGSHNCGHSEDVALVCVGAGSLRLTSDRFGSTNAGLSNGRLEVYAGGRWGTVCDDGFQQNDADVACQQLGYTRASSFDDVRLSSNYDTSLPILLDDVTCSSSDNLLLLCSHRGIGVDDCSHSEDIEITCLESPLGGSEGDARLVGVNGLTRGMAGRVEVYTSGQWFTITKSSSVGREEADVICRQLGFPNSVYYGSVGDLGFSQGVSTMPLGRFSCSGFETRWTRCFYYTSGFVSSSRDFAVSCGGIYSSTGAQYPPASGDLRLNTEGSSQTFSGRLEIYYNGQWGTVCDDGFAQTEADVACRQLGFVAALYYGSNIGISGGSGQIWLDDVDCSSSHTGTLADCSHSAFGSHNCDHSEDVALVCVGAGSLRLTSNHSVSTNAGLSSGRLEVFAGGRWGTVCDDGFGQTEADVACRQLGYIRASSFDDVRLSSNYNTSLPTLLDDVTCSSSDNLLLLCSHRGIGVENCHHSEDIEITCFKVPLRVSEGDARLVGMNDLTRGMAGRVEVYTSGRWITINESLTVGKEEADVICRQLGFPNSVYYGSVGDLGFSRGVSTRSLSTFSCSGSQTRWTGCDYSTSSSVSHYRDFAVSCDGTYSSAVTQDVPTNRDLRLNTAGSSRTFSGRLEIYYNGLWGTVCDNGFAQPEADVACRQLGFVAALYYGSNIGISGGSGQIWLDNVDCSSSHTGTLADCSHSGFGSHNCTHSEDVALVCVGAGSLRLTSDPSGSTNASLSSGRLEVYASGRWGTVCDDGFGQTEADVACRQLGYTRASSFHNVRVASNYNTSLPILLKDVTCSSSDNLLLLCSHRGIGVGRCIHYEDILITCSNSNPALSTGAMAAIGVLVPVGVITLFIFICIGFYFIKKKSSRNTSQTPRATTFQLQADTAYPMQQHTPYPVQTSSSTQPGGPQSNGQHAYPPAYSMDPQQSPTAVGQAPPAPYSSGSQASSVPYSSGSQDSVAPSCPTTDQGRPELYADAPPAYLDSVNYPNAPGPNTAYPPAPTAAQEQSGQQALQYY